MSYVIWGKVHGADILIKLHGEEKRSLAVNWMRNNKKYYNNMEIRKNAKKNKENAQ